MTAFKLTLRNALLAAAAASSGLLAAAFVAQYGFGLYPCELCLAQRYPYALVIALALAGAFAVRSARVRYYLLMACALLFLLDAGIAFYHAGVEGGLFKAPDACASNAGAGDSLEAMRAAIMNAPLVTCDQAMAHVWGLSLAAWNALAAAFLAAAAFFTLRRIGKPV